MTPILVYGFPQGSSLGLVIALEWLGQPYRLCRVDMLSEMKNAHYARLNDRQETPVLITGEGQVVTETMAIAAWMQARDTQHHLSYPQGSANHLRMVQIAAFINTSFTAAFVPLWIAMEGSLGPAANDLLRTIGIAGVKKRYDQLEAMVGDTPYLVGERPSIADAIFIGVARWLDVHQVAARSAWPKLDRIRSRIEALPAYQFAERVELGEAATSTTLQGEVPLDEVIASFADKT